MAVIAINTALGNWNDWLTPFLYINNVADSTLTAWLATLTSNLQQIRRQDQGLLRLTTAVIRS